MLSLIEEWCTIIHHCNFPHDDVHVRGNCILIRSPLSSHTIHTICLNARSRGVTPHAHASNNTIAIRPIKEVSSPPKPNEKDMDEFAKKVAASAAIIAMKNGITNGKLPHIEKTYYNVGRALFLLEELSIPFSADILDDMSCVVSLPTRNLNLYDIDVALHPSKALLCCNSNSFEIIFEVN